MLDAAIVGIGGRWAQVLVNSVYDAPDSGIRFIVGSTRTRAKAEDFAKAKNIRLLDSYEAILADPSVKAVVLATPHSQHAEQVIAAARAGKHVFVEKPFTLSKTSAEAAVKACRDAGLVMALGHNRRFLPAVAEMKKLIADGTLGTLCHVEGHFSGPGASNYKPGMWRADRDESPLGGMGGMGIHMIDMMINTAGRFADVTVQSHARVLQGTIDDTTAMLCRFANGATGTFATLAATARCWRLALFGSNGWLELSGHEKLTWTPVEGEGWSRTFPPVNIERAELAAFAAAVAGGPAYPLPMDDAIHSASVFEAMIASAKSGITKPVL